MTRATVPQGAIRQTAQRTRKTAAMNAALDVAVDGDVATVTLANPARRNVLTTDVLAQLATALTDLGRSAARGIVIAAEGPVFSAGHDLAELGRCSAEQATALFQACTNTMLTMQRIPQVVVARVHALATAAGCQLVASCDLAVAARSARFALPGGRGGLFCHTPLVAVARTIGRKRAAQLAFTGEEITAETAEAWGLINAAVDDDELVSATDDLLRRATRGSAWSKGRGKQGFYAQIEMTQDEAYTAMIARMAADTQSPSAQEGFAAFVGKRPARFD